MEESKTDTENQNILENVTNRGLPVHMDSYAPQKQKLPLLYNGVDSLFAFVFPVIGFLFIKLTVVVALGRDHLGAGVSVFTLCFLVSALIWARKSGVRMDKAAWLCLIPIVLAGSYFSIYQNTVLQFFSFLLLICMAAYYQLVLCKCRTTCELGKFLAIDLFMALASIPFGNFGKMFAIQGDKLKKVKRSRNILLLLAGVFLALPVSMHVGSLLKNADAAFEQFWNRFSRMFFSEDMVITLIQILISLPVSMYLFGLFFGAIKSGGRSDISKEKASSMLEKARALPLYLVIGSITPLLVIYVMFFFSQTAYFLSAFQGYLPQGMIYSDYARRGFFELCQVSFINLLFAGVLMNLTKGGQKSTISRLYTAIIAAISMALIVISLSKMLLYINIYGLTPLRVYTSWFMVFLFLLFLFLLVRIASPTFALIRYCAMAVIVMFLLLCYADTDNLIASYNVNSYRSGKLAQLDLYALEELGCASTPYLLSVMKDEGMDEEYRTTARQILQSKVGYIEHRIEDDWRSATFAGVKEKALLQANRERIGE